MLVGINVGRGTKAMKIHAYSVHQRGTLSLVEVVRHLETLGFEARWKSIIGKDMGVEQIREAGGMWLLDFAKIRYEHGPGKA